MPEKELTQADEIRLLRGTVQDLNVRLLKLERRLDKESQFGTNFATESAKIISSLADNIRMLNTKVFGTY